MTWQHNPPAKRIKRNRAKVLAGALILSLCTGLVQRAQAKPLRFRQVVNALMKEIFRKSFFKCDEILRGANSENLTEEEKLEISRLYKINSNLDHFWKLIEEHPLGAWLKQLLKASKAIQGLDLVNIISRVSGQRMIMTQEELSEVKIVLDKISQLDDSFDPQIKPEAVLVIYRALEEQGDNSISPSTRFAMSYLLTHQLSSQALQRLADLRQTQETFKAIPEVAHSLIIKDPFFFKMAIRVSKDRGIQVFAHNFWKNLDVNNPPDYLGFGEDLAERQQIKDSFQALAQAANSLPSEFRNQTPTPRQRRILTAVLVPIINDQIHQVLSKDNSEIVDLEVRMTSQIASALNPTTYPIREKTKQDILNLILDCALGKSEIIKNTDLLREQILLHVKALLLELKDQAALIAASERQAESLSRLERARDNNRTPLPVQLPPEQRFQSDQPTLPRAMRTAGTQPTGPSSTLETAPNPTYTSLVENANSILPGRIYDFQFQRTNQPSGLEPNRAKQRLSIAPPLHGELHGELIFLDYLRAIELGPTRGEATSGLKHLQAGGSLGYQAYKLIELKSQRDPHYRILGVLHKSTNTWHLLFRVHKDELTTNRIHNWITRVSNELAKIEREQRTPAPTLAR